jgi:ferredoxin-NADP reductase
MNEYTLEVTGTIKRTPMSTSVRMVKPEGFTYQPGQWAQFTVDVNGSQESKPLSLSSSPTELHLEFTKKLTGSIFSRAIGDLKSGDQIHFKGPAGNLVYTGGLEKVTFLAGGIGITPIRSILKYLADHRAAGGKNLLYANQNLEETAFLDEVNQWEVLDPDLRVVNILENPPEEWDGPTGFITRQIIEEFVPEREDQTFYVSGPPAMVDCVLDCFADLKVPGDRVIKEELKGYMGMT